MRIYNRKSKILQKLLSADDYITSGQLANEIGVSSRTIREDLKQLTTELENAGIKLTSVPGRGYGVNREDRQKAAGFFKERSEGKKVFPDLPGDRFRYILQTLLFFAIPVTLDELADRLYVSKSTLEHDLSKVEEWLLQQDLRLVKKPLQGMLIAGEEICIRYTMANYLLEENKRHSFQSLKKLCGFIKEHRLNILKEIIDSIRKTYQLEISDNDYTNLLIFLSISLERYTNHKRILSGPENSEVILGKKEYRIAQNIAGQIKQLLNVSLSEVEILFLSKYLMQAEIFGIGMITPENISELTDEKLVELVKGLLLSIRERFKADFCGDDRLVHGLVLYLNSLINRRKHKIHTKNPGLGDIKKEYPEALEMAVMVSELISAEYGISISEDEIGYVALYFCAAIESKIPEKRVVIICPAGMGGAQLLAVKVKRYFPELRIEGIYPAYRINEARQKNPDLILSTIPLDGVEIPVVQVNHLLSDENISTIRRLISSVTVLDDQKQKQFFGRLFTEDLFVSGITLNDREEVIHLLCNKLRKKGCVDEIFSASVLEREKQFSTAIGNLVAIPHALSGQSSASCITVGILKKPIRWGEEKVQLVFLLNIETLQEDNLKRIFDRFFDIIHSKNKISRLIKTSNFADFKQIIFE